MNHVTIYHNVRCSKSRETLALLKEHGFNPKVVEYLKDPPSESELCALLKKLDMEPMELVRSKEYKALGLPKTDDPDELLRRMAANPQVIERPIVVSGNRARLGRPPELVLEIL